MKFLPIGLLVAAVSLPATASAGELALSFKDGRVTLKASDVTLRQVLNEWARLGQTRIVGLEKLGGGLLTLELTNLPEKQALEILLRSIAGYAAAPRASVEAGPGMAANLSRFDRLMLLPTSIASAAPMAPPRPAAAFAPPPQAAFPDPIQLANQEAADAEEAPNPPGVPVFNPNGEPVTPAVPTLPGGPMPGQLRPPGADDPNAQAPTNGPAPVGTAPLVTTRPGVIPVPQTPPRP
jgi:hypothetical protein